MGFLTRPTLSRPATASIAAALAIGFLASPGVHARQNAIPDETPLDERRPDAIPLSFHWADEFLESSVAGPDDDDMAEVEDLLIDRATGRIEHVVISHGGLFDFDDDVAIPFEDFAFDAGSGNLVLNLREESLENMPEFKPERWVGVDDDDWFDELDRRERAERIETGGRADWMPNLADAEDATFDGRITRIVRQGGRDGDTVVLTLANDVVSNRLVILGPSWYVMDQELQLERGSSAEVVGFRAHDGRFFARTFTTDGRRAVLLDRDGTPRWRDAGPSRSAGDREPAGRSLLIRLSDLIGMDAGTTDEAEGEIQSAILELRTGRIAVLGFDPNENVLGIADTIRAVPWSAATVGTDRVRFDATAAVLGNALEMPEDVDAFASQAARMRYDAAFDASPARFEPRDRDDRRRRTDAPSPWDPASPVATAIQDAEPVRIEGRVVRRTTIRIAGAERPVAAIVIGPLEDAPGGDAPTPEAGRTVLLGPVWYLEQTEPVLGDGDAVQVEARRVTVDGAERLVAVRIASQGSSLDLWSEGRPAWRPGG